MLGVDRNNSHPFSSLTGSLEVKGVILQLPRLKLLLDGKNGKVSKFQAIILWIRLLEYVNLYLQGRESCSVGANLVI